MTYYFGFKPSNELLALIKQAEEVIGSGSDEPYYPLRDDITQKVAHELLDNMLINLIEVIPNKERKAKMKGVVHRLEGAMETVLSILLGKDSNAEVIPNYEYLRYETIFYDNEGNIRVGFELSDSAAKTILDGFAATTPDSVDKEKLMQSLFAINHAVVDHFLTRFSETLPLGMIKRKSIPVAKAGINKVLEVAIHKLFPQLPIEGLNRLAGFYQLFVVKIDTKHNPHIPF